MKLTVRILTKTLESILTIDGQGRPAKARALMRLMIDVPETELAKALAEIGDRKWF
jgi:hypothetical protein